MGSEPQYEACFEQTARLGHVQLGTMTSQVWRDDPRRLLFVLARYKFVAKMVEGLHVAEFGCGDGFASDIVRQAVANLTLYDFDQRFVAEASARGYWAIQHDVTAATVPRGVYDAAYALDVIEHIDPELSDRALANMAESTMRSGMLIIGTPSFESQLYASEQSKAGHVNCMNAADLRHSMAKLFSNVLMFSMNDEVVHTGYSKMAHYLFAIGTGRR